MSRASNRPASAGRPAGRSAGTGSIAFIASFAVLAAAGWILFVAGLHAHEMEVGIVAIILTLLFLLVVRHQGSNPLHLRLRDVAQGWRIPWYILSGSWEITIVLFRDLLSLARAKSLYRVCGFKSSKRDPLLITRQVLATVYTTTAPNFIVIGIDPEQNRMLFHQIERSSVPRMTQSLGAQQ